MHFTWNKKFIYVLYVSFTQIRRYFNDLENEGKAQGFQITAIPIEVLSYSTIHTKPFMELCYHTTLKEFGHLKHIKRIIGLDVIHKIAIIAILWIKSKPIYYCKILSWCLFTVKKWNEHSIKSDTFSGT